MTSAYLDSQPCFLMVNTATSLQVSKFTSLLSIHSLHDIHGIMSIIYKQVIEVNIEAPCETSFEIMV